MPVFTIETTRRLSGYRHRTYRAATPEQACRLAVEDEDWKTEKIDTESIGENYITGIWKGADSAYAGTAIAVASHFDETEARKARHFETLFGLLKLLVADARAGRPSQELWLDRAEWAIAKGEAIMAAARDPEPPAEIPRPPLVLAELHQHRVRDQIAGIVETDPEFTGIAPDSVTDADVRAACQAVATAMDLSEEIGSAEFRAAIAALRRHHAGGR